MKRTCRGSWERHRPLPLLDALSQRELALLECICRGLTNRDNAKALGISEHTVKNHVKAVPQKLDATQSDGSGSAGA